MNRFFKKGFYINPVIILLILQIIVFTTFIMNNYSHKIFNLIIKITMFSSSSYVIISLIMNRLLFKTIDIIKLNKKDNYLIEVIILEDEKKGEEAIVTTIEFINTFEAIKQNKVKNIPQNKINHVQEICINYYIKPIKLFPLYILKKQI